MAKRHLILIGGKAASPVNNCFFLAIFKRSKCHEREEKSKFFCHLFCFHLFCCHLFCCHLFFFHLICLVEAFNFSFLLCSANDNEVLALYTSFEETTNKCVLCGEDVDDPMEFGRKITKADITVHHFCLVILFLYLKKVNDFSYVMKFIYLAAAQLESKTN